MTALKWQLETLLHLNKGFDDTRFEKLKDRLRAACLNDLPTLESLDGIRILEVRISPHILSKRPCTLNPASVPLRWSSLVVYLQILLALRCWNQPWPILKSAGLLWLRSSLWSTLEWLRTGTTLSSHCKGTPVSALVAPSHLEPRRQRHSHLTPCLSFEAVPSACSGVGSL